MTLDARLHSLDARSNDFDGTQHVSFVARGAPTAGATDDETTVLRLAGVREQDAPEANDDEATVLRIARRARQTY